MDHRATLLERDEELAVIHDHLVSTPGTGGVVLVEGPPGCGRTALLHAAAQHARDLDVVVVRASAFPEDRHIAFSLVDALEAQFATSTASHTDPVERATRFTEAAMEHAGDRHLLVEVDDLHLVDEFSVRALTRLARLSDVRPVTLLCTTSVDHACTATDLGIDRCATHLAVRPLSGAATVELAGRLGAQSPDLFALTGGNPLLVRAVARSLQTVGRVDERVYGRAVLDCLGRASPTTREVADILAVACPDTDLAAVAALAGTSIANAQLAISTLEAAGLCLDGRFRHASATAAVAESVTASRRELVHSSLAEHLRASGADATCVAEHLVQVERPEHPWAADVLDEAAAQALATRRPELAATHLRIAGALREDDDAASRLASRLREADALFAVDPARCRGLWSPDSTGVPTTDPDTTARLVHHLAWHGEEMTARRVLDSFSASDDPAASAVRRHLEVWLARTFPSLCPPPRGVVGAQDRGDVELVDPWLRACADLAVTLTRSTQETALDRTEDLLRSVQHVATTPWVEEAIDLGLRVLLVHGRPTVASAMVHRFLEDLGPAEHTRRARLLAVRADIDLRWGDLRAALRNSEAALGALSRSGWGARVAVPLATACLATARSGLHAAASRHASEPVPALTSTTAGAGLVHARGHQLLLAGHPRAALAEFRRVGELLRTWALDGPGGPDWRVGAASAWQVLGQNDEARVLLSTQLGREDPSARAGALVVMAQIAAPARRGVLLTEALEIYESTGDLYGQWRALESLSRAHAGPQSQRRARLLLRQALHVASLAGAPVVAEEDQLPDDAEPEEERVRLLSDSERRVASFAVMGYTNREIARRLFVTPSTVEQHLTRVYRKLQVSSRSDLPVSLRNELTNAG